MKIKTRIIGLVSVLLLLSVLTGCTSSDGIRLTKGFIKQLDVNTLEGDSQISLSIETKGLNLNAEEQAIIDTINNTVIDISEQSDIKNSKYAADISVNVDGNMYNGSLYLKGEKIWAKIPTEDKYIRYSPEQLALSGEIGLSYQQQLKLQDKITPLAMKFVKDYFAEYKYAFDNITNKGKTVITTPEGQKEVSLIEVKIDNAEVKKLVEYTVKNMIDSPALVEYVKSVIMVMYDEDPSMFGDETKEQVIKDIDDLVLEGRSMISANPKDFSANLSQIIDTAMQYVQIGEQGLVFTYGLDNNDNIISADELMHLVIRPNADESQVISIVLKSKAIVYNINKSKVVFPQFTAKNTITLKEYVRNESALKETALGEALGVNRKRVVMTIGDNYATINNNYKHLETAPYIEGEYTLVPVRFIGEALGAKIDWNDQNQTATYRQDDKIIILTIGSNIAYVNGEPVQMPTAPIIVNEKTMVPLRFVSEQFGAQVDWDDYLNEITITKE